MVNLSSYEQPIAIRAYLISPLFFEPRYHLLTNFCYNSDFLSKFVDRSAAGKREEKGKEKQEVKEVEEKENKQGIGL